jgi:glycosyltransferase involved in cell wall biosynthesis
LTETLDRRLRVAYVYRAFNRSGSIPSFFVDRAERLAADEDVTAFCSARDRAATRAPIAFEDVEPLLHSSGRLGYAVECASFAWRAQRAIERLRPEFDVVHVVGFAAPTADVVTVNAVRRAELEHYFRNVEPEARIRKRLAPLLRPQSLVVEIVEDRLFRPPFPLCLTETGAIADDLKRVYGVPPDAVEVLPTGVDLELFRPDPATRASIRAESSLTDETLLVLFVGYEFGRKGLERAIEALARATTAATLWVVGGEEREPYVEQARRSGVLDRVRFLGRMAGTELARLYAAADVLLLPSRQDAWGQPALEAMACGCVPVVSEYTGIREALVEGENGYVVAGAGDPQAIAALLDGPIADATTRGHVAAAAVGTAAAFDRRVIYERLRDAHHRAYRRRLERGAAA